MSNKENEFNWESFTVNLKGQTCFQIPITNDLDLISQALEISKEDLIEMKDHLALTNNSLKEIRE